MGRVAHLIVATGSRIPGSVGTGGGRSLRRTTTWSPHVSLDAYTFPARRQEHVKSFALADGRLGGENCGMRARALLVALLVGNAARSAGQEPVDTALTIQGFLQQDNEVGLWTIVVPLPLQVLETRTYVVPLVGQPERWGRYLNRYIEASGRVTRLPERGNPGIGMEVEKAKELEPPGTARATVDHGMTLHADITLSVIPNRFRWRDTTGSSTGVNPLLVYTILNRRSAPIFFVLPTNRFLCVAVKSSEGMSVWDTATIVRTLDGRRFTMQRGGSFRDALHFPEDAASRPGHYYARVGICDVDDYDITAEFDVR